MLASYHSPLEGESQKPSRQAKADAVGGSRQAARAPAKHPKEECGMAQIICLIQTVFCLYPATR